MTKEAVAAAKTRRRARRGWTRKRQDEFIAVLSSGCNIAAALRKVRMSRSGLDKLRARDAGFRARMAGSVREAYRSLELFTLEKMMNGTVRTVTKADGQIETVHEYPLHLAVQLLRLHKDGSYEAEPQLEAEDRDAVLARLTRKVDAVRRRLLKEDAAGAGAGGAGA